MSGFAADTFTDPCDALASRKYEAPSEQELESLGVMYATGTGMRSAVGTTYLRVVVATLPHDPPEAAFSSSLRIGMVQDIARTVSQPIIRGLGLGAVTALERNRRSNFLRTQTAALRRYFEVGGALSDLDPTTVTKERLQTATAQILADRAAANPPTDAAPDQSVSVGPDTYRTRRAINCALRRLCRALHQLPAEGAHDAAEGVILALKANFPLPSPTPTPESLT